MSNRLVTLIPRCKSVILSVNGGYPTVSCFFEGGKTIDVATTDVSRGFFDDYCWNCPRFKPKEDPLTGRSFRECNGGLSILKDNKCPEYKLEELYPNQTVPHVTRPHVFINSSGTYRLFLFYPKDIEKRQRLILFPYAVGNVYCTEDRGKVCWGYAKPGPTMRSAYNNFWITEFNGDLQPSDSSISGWVAEEFNYLQESVASDWILEHGVSDDDDDDYDEYDTDNWWENWTRKIFDRSILAIEDSPIPVEGVFYDPDYRGSRIKIVEFIFLNKQEEYFIVLNGKEYIIDPRDWWDACIPELDIELARGSL